MIEKIQTIEENLIWPVIRVQGTNPEFRITTDPIQRKHIIEFPAGGDMPRPIEYLHELAHATLAEQVHPIFSTAYFALKTPDEYVQTITWPYKAVTDWFADGLLAEWVFPELSGEIEEHLFYVSQTDYNILTSNPFVFFSTALIIAEGVYWLQRQNPHEILQPFVDIFLATNPNKPLSVDTLVTLLNRLIAPLHVRIIHEVDLDVLDVSFKNRR